MLVKGEAILTLYTNWPLTYNHWQVTWKTLIILLQGLGYFRQQSEPSVLVVDVLETGNKKFGDFKMA